MTRSCTRWDAAAGTYCGRIPARLYAQGPRCATCTPAALAGQPEPGLTAYCAPLRHYCPPDNRCATWAQHQPLWRILATGGRDRTDKDTIWATFTEIHTAHPRLVVVHGAAYPKPIRGVRPDRSADWLIHLWCVEHGVYEETHPANWNTCSTPTCTPEHRQERPDGSTYCPLAGPHRNGEMAALGAHECVAFPGAGPSTGTRDCMRQAAAAGITVRSIKSHISAEVAQ
ncbi:SLOG family protein [Nonomuraea sp. NPDC050643]|uniref:SLOG family protein n=1 Tax=Nonomuraea sp. NPDC050643 TaxID=3155660 RepID=UPI0033C304AD